MFARRAMRRRAIVGAAVVGGTAYYAGKKRAQGQAHEAAQDAQIAEMQQAAYAPPPTYAPAPAAEAPGLGDQLAQLAKLHETGALSDQEYAAAKAKLLA
jgi:hypothetical protein